MWAIVYTDGKPVMKTFLRKSSLENRTGINLLPKEPYGLARGLGLPEGDFKGALFRGILETLLPNF